MQPLLTRIDPGAMVNKWILCIPQSSSITGALLSGYSVSYPGHLLEESYPSAEMQLVYSAAPADRAMFAPVSLFNGISTFLGYIMLKPSI